MISSLVLSQIPQDLLTPYHTVNSVYMQRSPEGPDYPSPFYLRAGQLAWPARKQPSVYYVCVYTSVCSQNKGLWVRR